MTSVCFADPLCLFDMKGMLRSEHIIPYFLPYEGVKVPNEQLNLMKKIVNSLTNIFIVLVVIASFRNFHYLVHFNI